MPKKNANILVAEDHAITRRNLQQVLQEEGYRVMVAPDGQEAVRQILYGAPDLVLTNFDMPHLNGLDVLTRIRQLSLSIPVFLITAYNIRLFAQPAQRLGVHSLIEKPVALDDLLGQIAAALQP